jgi:hypothetical protein
LTPSLKHLRDNLGILFSDPSEKSGYSLLKRVKEEEKEKQREE